MTRSIKKGPYVEGHLMKKVEALASSGAKRPIKTWSRRSMILPEFVGHTFGVHNGKNAVKITDVHMPRSPQTPVPTL